MFLLNTLKNYKLYQDKKFLFPMDEKDKFKGSLIVTDTKSLDDTISIINNPSINNRYIRCYYIDKTCYAYIRNVKKKELVNQANYYKKVKASCKNVLKTFPTMDKYEGLSLYYDISVLNKLFFENAVMADKTKMSVYKNYLNKVFDNEIIESYPNKIMICKIDNKIKNYDDYFNSLSDFLSILLKFAYLQADEILNFPNFEVIVLGDKSGRYFKFNLHTLNKSHLTTVKRLLNIIIKLENGEILSDKEQEEDSKSIVEDAEEMDTTSDKEIVKDKIKTSVGDSKSSKEKEIEMKIESAIDKKENSSDLEYELDSDQEFLEYLEELKQEKITAEKAAKNTARNELLKEEQKKVKIEENGINKTFEEIINETSDKVIKKDELPINNKNTEALKVSTLRDFEKSYNNNLDYKDKVTILNSLSDENRQIKVYIRNIKKEDSSTAFTKKETWTIELEDDRRVRHTIKLDFPIWINDKFLYIEGNKKVLNKQLVLLPIVKTRPDKVQVVTNSNKTFISRFGSKISPKIEKFKKLLVEMNKNNIEVKIGNNLNANRNYLTNIEYDEFAKDYTYFKIGNTVIYFNQILIRDQFVEKKIKEVNDKKVVPIGIENDKYPILYNMDTNILYTKEGSKEINLVDYIVELLAKKDPKIIDIYDNLNIGKKFVYSRCDILSRNIPLLVFLAYNEGLSTILHKAKINYELTDKRHVMSNEEKERRGVIPFKNKYLYYDYYPFANSLLLNSLLEVNTKDYDYEMFDSKDVYLEVFNDLYGTRTIAKGFDNFYELFVDGITKEVLEDMNYPTDITGLLLYANKLLEDNQYIPETEMSNYRLRSNEIVNIYFEKALEEAYISYKNSVNGATPMKMSIPQDKIIKTLLKSENLQDYNTLNPITESDSISTVTYKGPGGLTIKIWSTLNYFNYRVKSVANYRFIENMKNIRLTSRRTLV